MTLTPKRKQDIINCLNSHQHNLVLQTIQEINELASDEAPAFAPLVKEHFYHGSPQIQRAAVETYTSIVSRRDELITELGEAYRYADHYSKKTVNKVASELLDKNLSEKHIRMLLEGSREHNRFFDDVAIQVLSRANDSIVLTPMLEALESEAEAMCRIVFQALALRVDNKQVGDIFAKRETETEKRAMREDDDRTIAKCYEVAKKILQYVDPPLAVDVRLKGLDFLYALHDQKTLRAIVSKPVSAPLDSIVMGKATEYYVEVVDELDGDFIWHVLNTYPYDTVRAAMLGAFSLGIVKPHKSKIKLDKIIKKALDDNAPSVRQEALRAVEHRQGGSDRVLTALLKVANTDPVALLRQQATVNLQYFNPIEPMVNTAMNLLKTKDKAQQESATVLLYQMMLKDGEAIYWVLSKVGSKYLPKRCNSLVTDIFSALPTEYPEVREGLLHAKEQVKNNRARQMIEQLLSGEKNKQDNKTS